MENDKLPSAYMNSTYFEWRKWRIKRQIRTQYLLFHFVYVNFIHLMSRNDSIVAWGESSPIENEYSGSLWEGIIQFK